MPKAATAVDLPAAAAADALTSAAGRAGLPAPALSRRFFLPPAAGQARSKTAMLSTCAVCGNMFTAPAATQR